MAFLLKIKDDPLFARVLRSSSVLFRHNTLSLGLSILQGVLAARLLGPAGFGLIGVVLAFASTVNSIFSFRMSELVVRYGGEYLGRGEKEKAAGVIKAAGLTEAFVSLLAFFVVLLGAGFAESLLAKTPNTSWMFTVYALGLLANFNTETATGVLQITDRIKLQGVINLAQSMAAFLFIAGAYFLHENAAFVLAAYLAGKSIYGLGMLVAAHIQLRRVLGAGWARASLSALPAIRPMIRFAFSSNLSATLIKIFRESELLWVGFFLDTTAAGYYRVAYTIVHFLAVPADPLIATTFPEINRLAVDRAWERLRNFLRKVTAFSFAYNLLLGAGLLLFGRTILLVYSGREYLAAYPALAALTIGLVFNYTLFWNRPLLLSLGLPEFPIYATLLAGLLKLGLSFLLVAHYGVAAAAALLSLYYFVSVGAMVWRGLMEIKLKEKG